MYHYPVGATQSLHEMLNNKKQTETEKKGNFYCLNKF